jgi:hypothetical protein
MQGKIFCYFKTLKRTRNVRWIMWVLPFVARELSDEIHERKPSLPDLALNAKPPVVHPDICPAAHSPIQGIQP